MAGQEWNALLPMLLAMSAGKTKPPNEKATDPLTELLSLLPDQTGGAGILQTILSLLSGKGEAEQGSGGLSALLPLLGALQPQLGAQKEQKPTADGAQGQPDPPPRAPQSAAAAPGQDAGAIPADPARRCLQTAVPGAFDPIEHFAGEEIVQRREAYFAE